MEPGLVYKSTMPIIMPDPPVNILFKLEDGWFLVNLNAEALDDVKDNYKPTIWRDYAGDRWRIYKRKLEISDKLLTILKLKYQVLDNTRWKSR